LSEEPPSRPPLFSLCFTLDNPPWAPQRQHNPMNGPLARDPPPYSLFPNALNRPFFPGQNPPITSFFPSFLFSQSVLDTPFCPASRLTETRLSVSFFELPKTEPPHDLFPRRNPRRDQVELTFLTQISLKLLGRDSLPAGSERFFCCFCRNWSPSSAPSEKFGTITIQIRTQYLARPSGIDVMSLNPFLTERIKAFFDPRARSL